MANTVVAGVCVVFVCISGYCVSVCVCVCLCVCVCVRVHVLRLVLLVGWHMDAGLAGHCYAHQV